MSYRFKHKYSLVISEPPSINTTPQVITSDQDPQRIVNLEGDYRTEQVNAITITDLQITANISSSKASKNTNSTITVKGLNAESIAKIGENSIVILSAGFENEDLPVIFVGQVVSYKQDDAQTTSTVILTCKDGYTPTSAVKISKYYPENTTAKIIIEDLADVYGNNGIPLGRSLDSLNSLVGKNMDLPVDQIVYPSGKIFVGNLSRVLSKFLSSVGYTHYFSNARLYIEPENYNEGLSESFKVLPYHILSLRPSTTNTTTTTTAKDTSENKEGYTLKTLLDGRFEVGKFINLEDTDSTEGLFKITEVTHKIDYEGSSYFTEVEIQNV